MGVIFMIIKYLIKKINKHGYQGLQTAIWEAVNQIAQQEGTIVMLIFNVIRFLFSHNN